MREIDRIKVALSKSRIAVYEWDLDSGYIVWSGDMPSILQLSFSNAFEKQDTFLALVHKRDREKLLASIELCKKSGGDYNRNYRINHPETATLFAIRDRGTYVETPQKRMMIGTITSDVIDETTKENAITSPDTTFDRNFFTDKVNAALSLSFSEGKHFWLLKISIDNLPMMITWYSLSFANRIMQALELHIADILLKNDSISRVALDEFGIILSDVSDSAAEVMIDRILQRIQLYNNPSFEDSIHLRCSIGSIRCPQFANNTSDALNKSYLALTCAKNSNMHFHVDYESARQEHMHDRERVGKLHTMQNALRDDRLHIAYQPLIDAKTGEIDSYECLLRIHENNEYSSAGGLIPIAEHMGFIDKIDQFVLERIINTLEENPHINLGFNVSNLTTDNPQWLKNCSRLLQDPSVAQRVTVEITETAAQRDMRQTAYFVAAVQALGCKVALDDFGAGYTNFRQLKSLSVDIVKIDGAYIKNLNKNTEDVIFIQTLLQFTQSYGLETVAECVENGEIAKILMDLGVTYMQGYYFGMPEISPPWKNQKHPIIG